MTQLVKAMFGRLTDEDPNEREDSKKRSVLDGPLLPVQLNPTSFSIKRSNSHDLDDRTNKAYTAQFSAVTGALLTFDLEFDSADEGTTDQPFDVTKKLAIVRQFIVPREEAPKDAPFRVVFVWGPLLFTGIVTSLSEDFDYFASDGTALHAKLNVTIKEQNLRYQALAGARLATSAAISAGFSFNAGVGGQINVGGNLGFNTEAGLSGSASDAGSASFDVASSRLVGALQAGSTTGRTGFSANAFGTAGTGGSASAAVSGTASGSASATGSASASGSASGTATGSASASGSARADANWD